MSDASSSRPGRGDFVSLVNGIRISHGWMRRHTPQLLTAWREAPTSTQRRAVALQILQAVSDVASQNLDRETAVLADDAWTTIGERIDPRLIHGSDWAPFAAALHRAAAAGYDVVGRLPTLAAAAPLPARHPARELHWRLLDDCPAALPGARAPAAASIDVHSLTRRPQIGEDASIDRPREEASADARSNSEGDRP